MPPVDAGDYLIEILFEIGPVKSAMGGSTGIDETDLLAWQLNQETKLRPWECSLIRRLSRDYASMLMQAHEPHCLPPYNSSPEVTPDQRAQVANAFRALARSRNAMKKKKPRH